MSGGGSGKTQTQTTNNAPWQPQQAPLKQAIGTATNYFNNGTLAAANTPYQGQTVASLAPETQQAWAATAQRATNGSPLNTQNNSYLNDVLSGKYLNAGNPNQAALNQSISDAVLPTVESQFSAGGRYGSPSMGSELTRQLADSIAPSMYGQYQQERQAQQQASQLAPAAANQDYYDISQLGSIGNQRQDYQQQLINADQAKYQATQQQPLQTLQDYINLINGNYGGNASTISQQSQQINPWLTGAGAATSLLGSYLGGGGTFGL
jgi:hypothetical protein